MTVYTIQPAAESDLAPLPYPMHVNEQGMIGRQDFWGRQGVVSVVGFQSNPNYPSIDLHWSQFLADPQRAVGMYVVTSDGKRRKPQWSTHQRPVGEVKVNSGELVLNPQADSQDGGQLTKLARGSNEVLG